MMRPRPNTLIMTEFLQIRGAVISFLLAFEDKLITEWPGLDFEWGCIEDSPPGPEDLDEPGYVQLGNAWYVLKGELPPEDDLERINNVVARVINAAV